MLDTVISLRRPADYSPDQGARFEVPIKDGMSIRETAEALGLHRSKVERQRRKAMEEASFRPPAMGARCGPRIEIVDADRSRVVAA